MFGLSIRPKKSLPTTTITGIIAGVLALAVIATLLGLYMWRRERRKPQAVLPDPYLVVSEQNTQETRRPHALSGKSSRGGEGTGRDSQPRSPISDEQRHEQSLVAIELRALREEMMRISSAMNNGNGNSRNGNDGNLRVWEREERRDLSLPGYPVD